MIYGFTRRQLITMDCLSGKGSHIVVPIQEVNYLVLSFSRVSFRIHKTVFFSTMQDLIRRICTLSILIDLLKSFSSRLVSFIHWLKQWLIVTKSLS